MQKYNNLIFLIIFLIISILIICFNKIMDPFNISEYKKANENFSLIDEPRELAKEILHIKKNEKYDYVILGGSTSNSIFKSYKKYKFVQNNIFLLCLNNIYPHEKYIILKDFLDLHPEIKNVIVEINIHPYIDINESEKSKVMRYGHISKNYLFFKYYYSIDATKKSIQKLIQYIKKKKTKINEHNNSIQDEGFETYPNIKYQYSITNIDKNIEALQKIKELIDERKLNGIFYVPPVHSWHLAHCYKDDTYKYIEEAKRKFAKVTSFYDMAYVSEYTTFDLNGKLCFYYYDILHPSLFMQKEIIDVLIYKKENKNLSTFVTKDNIEPILEKQKNKLKNYTIKNEKEITQYVESKFNSEHYQNSKIITHYADLPEYLKEHYP